MSHASETATRNASGKITFLSDQNDLWAPEKVSVDLLALQENPDAILVVTGAALINEREEVMGRTYHEKRG